MGHDIDQTALFRQALAEPGEYPVLVLEKEEHQHRHQDAVHHQADQAEDRRQRQRQHMLAHVRDLGPDGIDQVTDLRLGEQEGILLRQVQQYLLPLHNDVRQFPHQLRHLV